MSVSTQLETLKAKVNEYFSKVITKLNEKPAVVSHSAGSAKLGGNTPAELSSQAAALSATHRTNTNNPHTVTPAQVNAYTQAEIDALSSKYIPQGILPLSRYGTLDYLPAGVSGSFEGATTQRSSGVDAINRREQYSFQLEDNGTLVFLRNGTDGSTQGVYYGYVQNAVNTFTGGAIRFTAKRYSPQFTPANNTVGYLYQGGTGALAGRFQDANGNPTNCFVAITNGTLDATAHQAVYLDSSWDTILDKSEIIVGENTVYILYNPYASPGSPSAGEPCEFRMYSIPLSAFASGSTVTPTELTFGQCIGFMGAIYNTGKIRLAALAEASNATTPAIIQHIGAPSTWFTGSRHIPGSGRIMTLSAFNADKSKLRVLVILDPRYNVPGGNLVSVKMAFSFVITMADLTVALDTGQVPMQISWPDTSVLVPTYTGTTFSDNVGLWVEGYTRVDMSYRPYITDGGIIFTSRMPYVSSSPESIYRGKWSTFTSIYDVLQAPLTNNVPPTREDLNSPLTFGSLAGDSFDGFRLLPNNSAVVQCRNALRTYALMKFRLKPAGQDLSTNYVYKSPTYPAGMNGYKPTVERTDVPEINRTLLALVLDEMTATSTITRGAVLLNVTGYDSRPLLINEDLTTSGTVSYSVASLNNLRDSIITAAGFDPTKVVGGAFIEVVVPQNTAVPVFATVIFTLQSGDRRTILATITASQRTGPIATLTLGSILLSNRLGVNANGTGVVLDINDGFRQGYNSVYEVSDGYMVVGNPVGKFMFPASSGQFVNYSFFVNKSDGSIQYPRMGVNSNVIPSARWGGLPGKGIGVFKPLDYNAKLIFVPWATSKTEMAAWATPLDSTGIVIISQEVAQGWIVYFTEDTPIIINGWSGVLASTSIDLTTVDADPANTTFYVYAENTGSTFVYRVYLTYTEPAQNQLYLGTVVTGNNGIAAINISKVTEFAGKRILTTPTGGAIPASPGLPSQVGALDSGWWPN